MRIFRSRGNFSFEFVCWISLLGFAAFPRDFSEKKTFPSFCLGNAVFVFRNLGKSFFCFFDDHRESRGIVDRQFAEIFSVDRDVRFSQSGDEAAVDDPERAARRVDADDPKAAEVAFFLTSVRVSVFLSAIYGVVGVSIGFGF